MDRFTGKAALITGGTTGIGLATAKLFINEGARVIVTGRTSATIKAAQAELGDNAIVINSDVTSLPDMDALAEKVKETFGKLDVLFVNAGYGRFIPFEAVTEEFYDEMLNLNAKGPYFIVQKLVPLMPEGSSVVFTTSVGNAKGVPDLSAYSAAKAALRSLTRSLAGELSPRGIRVNTVSPGPIETTVLQKVGMPKEASDQVYAQMKEVVPMKRIGQPEEVAKAASFLALDATYTTGTEFPGRRRVDSTLRCGSSRTVLNYSQTIAHLMQERTQQQRLGRRHCPLRPRGNIVFRAPITTGVV